jgi:hypothetical protein
MSRDKKHKKIKGRGWRPKVRSEKFSYVGLERALQKEGDEKMTALVKKTKIIFPRRELIIDGIKEFLRIGVIAIIPVVISQLETQKVDWKVVVIVFVVAILKAIDRGMHEMGRKIGNENLEKGILRF